MDLRPTPEKLASLEEKQKAQSQKNKERSAKEKEITKREKLLRGVADFQKKMRKPGVSVTQFGEDRFDGWVPIREDEDTRTSLQARVVCNDDKGSSDADLTVHPSLTYTIEARFQTADTEVATEPTKILQERRFLRDPHPSHAIWISGEFDLVGGTMNMLHREDTNVGTQEMVDQVQEIERVLLDPIVTARTL